MVEDEDSKRIHDALLRLAALRRGLRTLSWSAISDEMREIIDMIDAEFWVDQLLRERTDGCEGSGCGRGHGSDHQH